MQIKDTQIMFWHKVGIAHKREDVNAIPIMFEVIPRIGFYWDERITRVEIGWLCFYAHFCWIKYKIIKH